MKIERYNFLKKNEILKIIENNEFLESEKEKILMERPSEIVRFYDENKNIIMSEAISRVPVSSYMTLPTCFLRKRSRFPSEVKCSLTRL